MRILHVIHSVDPYQGGPSHVIRAVVREQVAVGHDVTLASTIIQGKKAWQPADAYRQGVLEEETFRGCELNLLDAWGRRKPWSTYAFSPAGGAWFRQRFNDPLRLPELVHIHGVFSHITSLAATESLRHGVPYVIRPAGILDTHMLHSGRAWLKRLFLQFSLRHQLQKAAAVHATSGLEAEELARWAPQERIRTVPLGVDVQCRPAGSAGQRFLARFPQLQGKRIVLFVGRIAAIKRPEMLVEAVAALRQEVPDIALLFVGHDDGGMAAAAAAARKHRLEGVVVHAGFLQGEDKDGAFAAAQLFAMPSLHENFGVAVVEAMAHGLPVLIAPGVAAQENVLASGGGLVVEATSAALAHGMRQVLAGNPQRMGQAGRQFVEKNLSWPIAIARIDEMYREAISRSGPITGAGHRKGN